MNKPWLMPTTIAVIAIVVGCIDNSKPVGSPSPVNLPKPSAPSSPSATSSPAAPAPTVVSISLTPVDRAAYDVAVAKHRGKVVLVDFWATWCQPCVEQLPHTLDLGRKLGDRGLAVVTVSCDEPQDPESVARFLATQKAEIATNLISEFGGSPATMEKFEIEGGAVPFYKLYDRRGELRRSFGVPIPGEIDQAVEQLLAE
jgi:thiol-disulfide isomerase/thioredoxin